METVTVGTVEQVGTVEAVQSVLSGDVVVVKRGRGRPKGSKNKPKVVVNLPESGETA